MKRTPLKRGGPLRPRSKRTQEVYETKRKPLVQQILTERPWCEACKVWAAFDGKTTCVVRPSKDCHEIKPRSATGGVHTDAWLDPANILAVCRECHNRIGDQPKQAKKLGLLT